MPTHGAEQPPVLYLPITTGGRHGRTEYANASVPAHIPPPVEQRIGRGAELFCGPNICFNQACWARDRQTHTHSKSTVQLQSSQQSVSVSNYDKSHNTSEIRTRSPPHSLESQQTTHPKMNNTFDSRIRGGSGSFVYVCVAKIAFLSAVSEYVEHTLQRKRTHTTGQFSTRAA